MNQFMRPLYGELVIPYQPEEQSGIPGEVDVMKDTIRQMVAEAAYYLAEKRGFHPGYELDDWLQAEADIKNKCKLS